MVRWGTFWRRGRDVGGSSKGVIREGGGADERAGGRDREPKPAGVAEGVDMDVHRAGGQDHSTVEIVSGRAQTSPIVIDSHHNETDTSTPQVAFIRPSQNATFSSGNSTVLWFDLVSKEKFKILGFSAC